MSPSARLRAFARAGVKGVAGMVLLFQAVALLHVARTPHVTCAEHGERLHLDAPAADGTVSAAASASGPAVAADDAVGADADAHDHCRLQHQGRTHSPAPDRAFVAIDDRAPTAPDVRAALPTARIFSFAPKTSPPRTPAA